MGAEELKPLKTRRAWLAVLIGLLMPAFGYLWVGAGTIALLLVGISFIQLGLLYYGGIVGIYALAITAVAIWIFVILDVWRRAKTPFVLKWYNKWYFYVLFILLIGGGAEALKTYYRANVTEFFKMPSGSSIPTILPGDYIAVDKRHYRDHMVARGDMIVFVSPDDPSIKAVKRVIGLPGEELQVTGSAVLVNGNRLEEPFARWRLGGRPEGNFGPVKIPEGHYIVLGDNRDESRDSRFWKTPFVPAESILGKVSFIYWSWNGLTRIGKVIQ